MTETKMSVYSDSTDYVIGSPGEGTPVRVGNDECVMKKEGQFTVFGKMEGTDYADISHAFDPKTHGPDARIIIEDDVTSQSVRARTRKGEEGAIGNSMMATLAPYTWAKPLEALSRWLGSKESEMNTSASIATVGKAMQELGIECHDIKTHEPTVPVLNYTNALDLVKGTLGK